MTVYWMKWQEFDCVSRFESNCWLTQKVETIIAFIMRLTYYQGFDERNRDGDHGRIECCRMEKNITKCLPLY